ncbi:hypothetical protein PanWU01x14_325640 [Parasponia andersonii]|uniref:Uncharacterized protein n=1 Tax=Parasponia andersonii TaxID=3476 RepID=A0A2P5AJT2_PARAD|nr:hypothetical protein PanWU01x14_325640 [Parasponia andersonii]
MDFPGSQKIKPGFSRSVFENVIVIRRDGRDPKTHFQKRFQDSDSVGGIHGFRNYGQTSIGVRLEQAFHRERFPLPERAQRRNPSHEEPRLGTVSGNEKLPHSLRERLARLRLGAQRPKLSLQPPEPSRPPVRTGNGHRFNERDVGFGENGELGLQKQRRVFFSHYVH